MISAKEEPSLSIPPAMDGLLKVHKRIIDVDHDSTNTPSGAGKPVSTRLLVAATQAAILIGKQGATVKSIQDESHCTIRILGGGDCFFNLKIFSFIVSLRSYRSTSVACSPKQPCNAVKSV